MECDDGTVQIFVKHTDIANHGVSILEASRGSGSVIMNALEGHGNLASENRLIATFRMGKGTLHKPGAAFNLNWSIHVNFDLHTTELIQ